MAARKAACFYMDNNVRTSRPVGIPFRLEVNSIG